MKPEHHSAIQHALGELYGKPDCDFEVMASWNEGETVNFRIKDSLFEQFMTMRFLADSLFVSYRESWTQHAGA